MSSSSHSHSHHHSRSHPPCSSSAAVSSSTTQACAACKYQRRKCAPDCILAPYFPHDRQRQFLNAHKLFGVSNITKIIKNLDPFEKEEAMRTIIFQSDVRSLDPVGGCYRIIRDLQRQIEYSKAELDIVLHQLAICKQAAAAAQRHEAVMFNGEMVLMDPDPLNGYGGVQQQPQQPPQHQFLQPYEVEEETEAFMGQFGNNNENNNNNIRESLDEEVEVEVWGMQDSLSSSSSLHMKQGGGGGGSVNDFDDIKLDTDHGHHQQLKFHPHHHHDLLHHSEEAMLKMDNVMLKDQDSDPIQQAQDQELKGAIDTLFTFPNSDT